MSLANAKQSECRAKGAGLPGQLEASLECDAYAVQDSHLKLLFLFGLLMRLLVILLHRLFDE